MTTTATHLPHRQQKQPGRDEEHLLSADYSTPGKRPTIPEHSCFLHTNRV